MRPFIFKLSVAILFSALALPTFAADFNEVIRAVNVTQSPDGTQQFLSGTIYGASIVGTISDNDGDNSNYQDGDTMTVTLSNGSDIIATPGPLTPSEFEQWVKDNADTITKILFPSGIASSVSGVDDSQAMALAIFNNIVAPSVSPREHAASQGEVDQLAPLREGSALFEFEDFRVDGTDGGGVNVVPAYAFSIGRAEFGFNVPLRYSFLDDEINTKAYQLGLGVHGGAPIVSQKNWAIYLLGGGFFNALYFSSDAIDSSGFVRYGGFGGFSARAVLRPFLLTGGAAYTASKFDIPNQFVSEDIKEIVNAIEDRPTDQQINIGANLGLPFALKYVLNFRLIRTQTIGDSAIDEGKRNFYTANASLGAYFSANSALDMGYKKIFGAEDLKAQSIMLMGRYNF